MDYLLGVDIGTTSVKAIAFSESGEFIIKHSRGYEMQHPKPGYSELNAEEILDDVIECINNIIESLAPGKPLLISFSAMVHSLIAMDENGNPFTNCIIWADNRASQIALDLCTSDNGRKFYQATGVPIHAMSPLCKLIWLKENEPSIYNSAYKFIGIKEFIFHKICDEYIVDSSVASSTGLLNIKTLEWDEDILGFLGLGSSSLSKVVSPKHIIKYEGRDNKSLLIPEGTMIIIGGSDGTLSNLGTGSADGNSITVTIGTSAAARIVTNHVETDNMMRTFCYHLKDNLYVIGGAGNNGAIVLEWLQDKLLETTESLPELFTRAEKIEPGCDGLLFLPYILGERAPIWNSNARGVFFGLDINHTKSHLVRACMEGVIFGIYSIVKVLLEKRIISVIHATGGFAQSDLWVQMLSDVCKIKVLVSANIESSALGAVMVGMEALGQKPFNAIETLSSYEPDVLTHDIYMKSYNKFERIYESVKAEWD